MNEPIRILFVDDEPALRRLMSRQLRAASFDVTTAGDGVEALELLRAQRFDVLISDLDMPRMDGLALMKHARAEARDTLRVLLTAHATTERAIEAINEGEIFRFLLKPLDSDLFHAFIETLRARVTAAARTRTSPIRIHPSLAPDGTIVVDRRATQRRIAMAGWKDAETMLEELVGGTGT